MAIKKGMFQNYVQKQNEERKKRQIKVNNSKYHHNKVYETDAHNEEVGAEIKSAATVKTSKQKLVVKKQSIKKESIKQNNLNIGDIQRNILTLTGIQKKLFFELLKLADKDGKYVVEKISNITLQELTETTHGNIKLAIYRLVKKGLLERYKGKTSKFGYYNLGFREDVFKFSLGFAQDMKLEKTHHETLEVEG